MPSKKKGGAVSRFQNAELPVQGLDFAILKSGESFKGEILRLSPRGLDFNSDALKYEGNRIAEVDGVHVLSDGTTSEIERLNIQGGCYEKLYPLVVVQEVYDVSIKRIGSGKSETTWIVRPLEGED